MSKPDWCPQNVWDEAWGVEAWARALYADDLTDSEKEEVVEAIAAAILAATEDEREACAQRVISYAGEAGEHNDPPEIRHLTGIVRAIRKRGEP